MERLALNLGFHKDNENRFFDDHGSCIGKTSGALFPWEQRSVSGEVIRHYWPKDHCLEREPLQLEADVWGIVEKYPETYVLVLSNPEGQPVEVSEFAPSRYAGTGRPYPAPINLSFSVRA